MELGLEVHIHIRSRTLLLKFKQGVILGLVFGA